MNRFPPNPKTATTCAETIRPVAIIAVNRGPPMKTILDPEIRTALKRTGLAIALQGGYRSIYIPPQKPVNLGRFLARIVVGSEAIVDRYIDHWNGQVWDYRLDNLRILTPAENHLNSESRRAKGRGCFETGYVGVFRAKDRDKYRCTWRLCQLAGRPQSRFQTPEGAAVFRESLILATSDQAQFRNFPSLTEADLADLLAVLSSDNRAAWPEAITRLQGAKVEPFHGGTLADRQSPTVVATLIRLYGTDTYQEMRQEIDAANLTRSPGPALAEPRTV